MDLQQRRIGEDVVVDAQFGRRPLLHRPVAARHLDLPHVLGEPRTEVLPQLQLVQMGDALGLEALLDLQISGLPEDEHLHKSPELRLAQGGILGVRVHNATGSKKVYRLGNAELVRNYAHN